MSAGPEARHENDQENELENGITAAGPPGAARTEQRIESPGPATGDGAGAGALPAPSGVICLCVIAGRHQRAADPVQLTRALGLDPACPVTRAQILLAAKELGLKARAAHISWDALPRRSLPLIAELGTGEFVVLLRSEPDGQLLVGDPRKHLLHIPLQYFELRRVGDTVARVRELESIRSFLTGSSINVILDLAFTVVFIAVMLLYSGLLTVVTLASIPLFLVLSLVMRPLLRERLGEKFDRGAENQSYLVEAVTGVQTVKAMGSCREGGGNLKMA